MNAILIIVPVLIAVLFQAKGDEPCRALPQPDIPRHSPVDAAPLPSADATNRVLLIQLTDLSVRLEWEQSRITWACGSTACTEENLFAFLDWFYRTKAWKPIYPDADSPNLIVESTMKWPSPHPGDPRYAQLLALSKNYEVRVIVMSGTVNGWDPEHPYPLREIWEVYQAQQQRGAEPSSADAPEGRSR